MQCVQKHGDDVYQADVIGAAQVLVAKLPERECAKSSRLLYGKTFNRMWREEILDALRPGIARDTYQVRKAALHYCGRRLILAILTKLDAVAAQSEASSNPQDAVAYQNILPVLDNVIRRLAPAIERDPPQWDETADFRRVSRWKTESGCTKARGAASKKHVLKELPRDWIAVLWSYVPSDHQYRDAIAVLSVSPARRGEMVPGDRPSSFSDGVRVVLDDEGCLMLTHSPQKTHNGEYGMEYSGVRVEPMAEGPSAEYLAQRCREEGGEFLVMVNSANALSKAIKRIGHRAFPAGPAITPNVLRSQRLADAKVAFGAGEKVALAAGHCTDRTQSKYGNVIYGRKGGLLDAFGSRKPRLVAVARAHELGETRRSILNPVRTL
jgi:hypothetical protein